MGFTQIILYQTESSDEAAADDGKPCLLGFNNFSPEGYYLDAESTKTYIYMVELFPNICDADDDECVNSLWKYDGSCRRDLRFKAFAKFSDGR